MSLKKADKSLSRSVSLPLSTWEELDKKEGGRSVYIRNLIEQDKSGVNSFPTPKSPDCIVSLLDSFDPTLVERARVLLSDADQPLLLARTLRSVISYLIVMGEFTEGALKSGRYGINVAIDQFVDEEKVAEENPEYQAIKDFPKPPPPTMPKRQSRKTS